MQPTDARVTAAERARGGTGRTSAFRMTAQSGPIDLGGPVVSSWSYGGILPGPCTWMGCHILCVYKIKIDNRRSGRS